MRKITNFGIAGIAVAAVAVTGTGVAFAYWTTSGQGTGSAVAAGANGTLTLTASWAADALHPGGDEVVTFKAANPGETDLRVNTISLRTTDPFTVDAAHAACVLTDFDIDPVLQKTDDVNGYTVPGGTALASPMTLPVTGLITFANDADTSQDACKGATITAHLVSN